MGKIWCAELQIGILVKLDLQNANCIRQMQIGLGVKLDVQIQIGLGGIRCTELD